jgi:hypothetical protein
MLREHGKCAQQSPISRRLLWAPAGELCPRNDGETVIYTRIQQ